ncbi:hypothetical protein [Neobacillus sp. DY30]|uniref:hypothetical protein n=1 Tax=Neobacillus sp. DY30 TaxID=3047871 RepID=UPI0024BFC598|nr:hypothetical protein [Neobacillus sp. DY30]WHY01845.1 hypothetical protein QNH29_06350 [Neobacillus sp. DY30]
MPRKKRNMKDMFEEFDQISSNVKALSGIVQNQGTTVSDEYLMEWIDSVNGQINQLNSLKEDVVRFYQD